MVVLVVDCSSYFQLFTTEAEQSVRQIVDALPIFGEQQTLHWKKECCNAISLVFCRKGREEITCFAQVRQVCSGEFILQSGILSNVP